MSHLTHKINDDKEEKRRNARQELTQSILSLPEGQTLSLSHKISLVLFGLIVFFVALEIVIRTTLSGTYNSYDLELPTKWYLPSSSTDNRDFGYPPSKAPDTFRIITIGDSATFGPQIQFDDTFSKRLERMMNLNDVEKGKVEVLNWGVPGSSTARQVGAVSKAVSKFSADLVILQISLDDPEPRPFRIAQEWHQLENSLNQKPNPASIWQTYDFISSRLNNFLLAREYENYFNHLFEDPSTWDNFSKSLDRIQAIIKESKTPILAVVFPLLNRPYQKYPFEGIHHKIAVKLNRLHVPYLDLMNKYNNIPVEKLLSPIGSNFYPNELSHRIAADAIYERLEDDRIIPAWAVINKMRSTPRVLK